MLTPEQHIDNLVRHIEMVRSACLLLGKRLMEAGLIADEPTVTGQSLFETFADAAEAPGQEVIVTANEPIKARGGFIIGISPEASDVWDVHIPVADIGEGASIVNAVPPQVLAYELAIRRGLDPDKPRNLAKSVTVK